MFSILIGLVILAFPVVAISALVLAIGASDRTRELNLRFAALERRMAQIAAAPAPEPEPIVDRAPPEAETRAEAATPPAAPTSPPVAPEPAAAVPPSPPQVTAPSAPGPAEPAITFEERFGTRWVVWVGVLALALGVFFLVRYSIEQDLIGPGVKIFLAALLAAALGGAGEWTRRMEQISGLAGLPTAHIPSIVTAAGTAVGYATVYAAYALYGFLDPALAFVLLGVVALTTLLAALLHGPALAALGVVGAEVTPLLVSTDRPSYWTLYVYLAVVTAAAFGLARVRLWRWLAIMGIGFGVAWMFPGIHDLRVPSLAPHAFEAGAGSGLPALLIVAGLLYGPPAEPNRIDAISSGALAAYVLAAAVLVLAWRHDTFALVVFSALAAATVAIAWRTDAAAAAVPAARGLAGLVVVSWSVQPVVERLVLPGGPSAGAIPDPAQAYTGFHLALGAFFALLFGAAGFLAQGRAERPLVPILWAASSVLAPIAILIALYYRVAGWERSIPFAGLALALAALFAVATETLARRAPRPGSAAAQAIYASGAVAALALAMTFALEKGWLTVALALMVPGIAWVAAQRPLPMLRWLPGAPPRLGLGGPGWGGAP